MSAYLRVNTPRLGSNGGGEIKAPMNLPEKRNHGQSLRYNSLFQEKYKERGKNIPFVKIGTKTGLFIHTENVKILTYIKNIL